MWRKTEECGADNIQGLQRFGRFFGIEQGKAATAGRQNPYRQAFCGSVSRDYSAGLRKQGGETGGDGFTEFGKTCICSPRLRTGRRLRMELATWESAGRSGNTASVFERQGFAGG